MYPRPGKYTHCISTTSVSYILGLKECACAVPLRGTCVGSGALPLRISMIVAAAANWCVERVNKSCIQDKLVTFMQAWSCNAWYVPTGHRCFRSHRVPLSKHMHNSLCAGYGVSERIKEVSQKVSDPHCWACGYCDSKVSVYSISMFGAILSAGTR
jgi:hypothetical protein